MICAPARALLTAPTLTARPVAAFAFLTPGSALVTATIMRPAIRRHLTVRTGFALGHTTSLLRAHFRPRVRTRQFENLSVTLRVGKRHPLACCSWTMTSWMSRRLRSGVAEVGAFRLRAIARC